MRGQRQGRHHLCGCRAGLLHVGVQQHIQRCTFHPSIIGASHYARAFSPSARWILPPTLPFHVWEQGYSACACMQSVRHACSRAGMYLMSVRMSAHVASCLPVCRMALACDTISLVREESSLGVLRRALLANALDDADFVMVVVGCVGGVVSAFAMSVAAAGGVTSE